jgi:hypothetical protein
MKCRALLLALGLAFLAPWGNAEAGEPALTAESADRFARLALDCVHREYPNKIAHTLSSDADVKPPRELSPAFFGCYDWHSSVHGHWLLARLARLYPDAAFAAEAKKALGLSLTKDHLEAEVAYLQAEGRVSFERPYGIAWLLQLAAELRQWEGPQAKLWREALAPLERLCAERIKSWLPKLTHPIRVGEHSQTAFAFGLILDWARIADDGAMEDLLVSRIEELYLGDRACPLAYEPSGQDFLSPCIAEADLMRRILAPDAYVEWLYLFLPQIPSQPSSEWLPPAIVTDPSDPKLAHLDGLNLSRAWMLEGMASALPAEAPQQKAILAAAQAHREAGLASVTGEHYEGGHWLGSFATYLVTGRGLASAPAADQ